MYMAIGQCGSVLGSHLFPNTDKPRYMSVRSLLRGSYVLTAPDGPLPGPTQPWFLRIVWAVLLWSSLCPRLDRTSFSPYTDINSTIDANPRVRSGKIHYRYENARRDRVYGKREPGAKVDTQELADRVSFPSVHSCLSLLLRLLSPSKLTRTLHSARLQTSGTYLECELMVVWCGTVLRSLCYCEQHGTLLTLKSLSA